MGKIGGLGFLTAALMALAGCADEHAHLKPPKQPEQLVAPPDNVSRFSMPPEYPKGTLNEDVLLKQQQKQKDLNAPGSLKGPGPSGFNNGGGF